jgi:hypothetical protein
MIGDDTVTNEEQKNECGMNVVFLLIKFEDLNSVQIIFNNEPNGMGETHDDVYRPDYLPRLL